MYTECIGCLSITPTYLTGYFDSAQVMIDLQRMLTVRVATVGTLTFYRLKQLLHIIAETGVIFGAIIDLSLQLGSADTVMGRLDLLL